MKLNKIFLFVAVMLTAFSSCRQDDDFIPSYGGNDWLVMSQAGGSFGQQFDAMWKAINSNYVAWEIETVDWDGVYDKYYPEFVQLDTLVAHGGTVSDSTLMSMYHAVLDTLHDGHSYYMVRNRSTKHYLGLSPQNTRNMRRYGKDYRSQTVPFDIRFYASDQVPETERFATVVADSVSCKETIKNYLTEGIANLDKALTKAQSEAEKKTLTEQSDSLTKLLNTTLPKTNIRAEKGLITEYNACAAAYHDARMPQYVTSSTDDERVKVMSGLTNDGIAYFRLSMFTLTSYMTKTEEDLKKMEKAGKAADAAMIRQVKDTWAVWFNGIQKLSKAGQLKGVIIDVRCNPGGSNTDQRYVLGALMAGGGRKIGTAKMKTGTGRLDYSIDYDFSMETMSDTTEHAVIEKEPIVVLCDHNSVSNAEMTAVATKQLPNGVVIGSQTYGGMSALIPGWNAYSISYSGEFGVEGTTPIYGYQPICLVNYTGHGVLEGVGVSPTEGYNVDYKPVKVANPANPSTPYIRDNQLEAALTYIRSK